MVTLSVYRLINGNHTSNLTDLMYLSAFALLVADSLLARILSFRDICDYLQMFFIVLLLVELKDGCYYVIKIQTVAKIYQLQALCIVAFSRICANHLQHFACIFCRSTSQWMVFFHCRTIIMGKPNLWNFKRSNHLTAFFLHW